MPPDMSGGRWHVVVLCCAVVMACMGGALALDAQGAALLAWKRTLGGGGALGDWDPADASPCRWTGVSCNAGGGVTELSLQFVDLHGGVPDNLSAAMGATLERLLLTGTNLSGPIPLQLGDLSGLVDLR